MDAKLINSPETAAAFVQALLDKDALLDPDAIRARNWRVLMMTDNLGEDWEDWIQSAMDTYWRGRCVGLVFDYESWRHGDVEVHEYGQPAGALDDLLYKRVPLNGILASTSEDSIFFITKDREFLFVCGSEEFARASCKIDLSTLRSENEKDYGVYYDVKGWQAFVRDLYEKYGEFLID